MFDEQKRHPIGIAGEMLRDGRHGVPPFPSMRLDRVPEGAPPRPGDERKPPLSPGPGGGFLSGFV